MKYIRTKDGRIIICDETNIGWCMQCENGIKYADTIEELCDEFVILDNRPPKSKILEKDFDKSFMWFNHCKIGKQDIIMYGAIWTVKGLIYVAKMNDKGELELLCQ